MLKVLLSDTTERATTYISNHFQRIEKNKNKISITITKVEASTDDSFEPIEAYYGKTSIIATSV